jgi:uncharacterized membrane protein
VTNLSLHLKTRVLTAVVVLANVFGNFFMSWGLRRRGTALGTSALEYVTVLFNPWVALGVGLLILWLLSRMTLLSWADLSYVLPVTAIGYILTAALGRFFLSEQVTPWRWLGTLLIVAGVALAGSTAIQTVPRERAKS